MTQQELINQYIQEFGSILPAKNVGRAYGGGFFGAELSRVCRLMRKQETLESRREGKFERFYLKGTAPDEPEVIYSPPKPIKRTPHPFQVAAKVEEINRMNPFGDKKVVGKAISLFT